MSKHLQMFLLLAAAICAPWVANGQTFNYACDFDSDSDTAGWVFVNGSQTNKWFIGTATHNSGTKSLYISNDNGVSCNYTNSTTVFVYAYQEFTLDSGSYDISYDWKCYGESNYDYIRVFLAPASHSLNAGSDPSGGTSAYSWSSATLPSGFISLTGSNTKFNLQSSWQSFYTTFNVSSSGSYRLVFAWANDASGGSTPPGAIDNIVISQPLCPRITSLDVQATAGAARLFWNISDANNEADSYEIAYRYTSDTFATPSTATTTDLSYTLSGLDPDTSYTVTVTPDCGTFGYGSPRTVVFNTSPLPCLVYDTVGSGPAESHTVGTPGTSTTNVMPVYGSYNYSYCNHLIRSSDIDINGPTAISGIDFQYADAAPMTSKTNCTIYMCHTSLTSCTEFANPADLVLVYEGPLNCTASGWNHFDFNRGNFNYNGVSNIMVAIVDNSGATETNGHFYYENVGSAISHRVYRNDAPYSFADLGTVTAGNSVWRTNMRLTTGGSECLQQTFCAAPAAHVDSIFSNEAYLSWIPGYQETDWSVEFKASSDTSWTTAAAATSSLQLTISGLNANTDYNFRITALCSDTSICTILSAHTRCGAQSVPFTQNFENEPTGSSSTGSVFATCWTRLNNGTSSGGYPYVSSSSSYNHTPGGSKGLYWYNTTTTGTYGDYQCVVLPDIDTTVSPINTLQLRFWAKSSSSSYYPVFIVGVMTDPNDINTFSPVQTINVSNSTAWDEYVVDLNSYTGNGKFVAIRANRPSSSWYAYVDDITLRTIPVCPDITDLSAGAVSASSAVISWRTRGGLTDPTSFEILYDSINSTSAPTSISTSDLFTTLLNLEPGVAYKVRVKAVCGSDEGDWDSVTFSTLPLQCFELDPTSADTVIFSNSSSGTSGCIAYSSWGNTVYQTVYTAAELTAAGLSAGPIHGIDLGFTASSSYNKEFTIFLGNSNTTSISDATIEDISSHLQVYGPEPHPMGTSGWQHYEFDDPFNWDGTSSIMLTTFMNQPSGTSQSSSSGLTGYYVSATNTARYRYKDSNPFTLSDLNSGSSGSTYSYRASIHFYSGECMTMADCAEPVIYPIRNEAYEVELGWLPGYMESSWDVAYRQGSTGSWTSAIDGTSSSSYTFTNLSPNTTYQFRVTALCSDTSLSAILTLTTPCSPMNLLPFTENFESQPTGSSNTGTSFVSCWHRLNNGSTYGGYPYVSNSTTYNHTTGGSRGLYWYNSTTTGTYGDYQCIVLPPVDSTVYQTSNLQLTFWAKSSSTSYYPLFYVGVLTDPDDITTFTYVDTINVGNNTDWQEFEVPLNAYTGNGTYVAIRANRPSSSWYAYVDDITLDVIPACPRVNNLMQTDATLSSVTINWEEAGEATQWVIEYDTVEFVPGHDLGTTITASDTNYTITGLDSSMIYYIYVAADCGSGEFSPFRAVLGRPLASEPAELPFFCNFEADGNNGWTLLNGSQTNAWYVGSAAASSSSRSLYISNDGGTSNSYNTSSISYAYALRAVNFADSGEYSYTYDWRSQGESHYYDFTRVFISPYGYEWPENDIPAGGTYAFSTWTCPQNVIEITENFGSPATLATSSDWRTATGTFRINTPGVYNIVFAWANDGGGGSNPPTAIDNVGIVQNTCPTPQLFVDHTNQDSIVVYWLPGGDESSWIVTCDSLVDITYDTFYVFENLLPNTNYNIQVRAICDVNDTSLPAFVSARTQCGRITALPFFEDFEGLPAGASSYAPPDCGIPCWARLDNASTYHFGYIGSPGSWPTGGHSGTGFVYYYMPTTTGTYADWILTILPPFDGNTITMNQLQMLLG